MVAFLMSGCLANHTVLVEEFSRVATYESLKQAEATLPDATVVVDTFVLVQDLLDDDGEVDLDVIKMHIIAKISQDIDDPDMRVKILRYADSITNYIAQYLRENPILFGDDITSREHDVKLIIRAVAVGAEKGASEYILYELVVTPNTP